MKSRIFKTWQKATYFKGVFKLRDENENWASPIEFPIVFTAYGAAIKSGNWQSATGINTPEFVIKHYFDGIGKEVHDSMSKLWQYCFELENITWNVVHNRKEYVLNLIELANNELNKLTQF